MPGPGPEQIQPVPEQPINKTGSGSEDAFEEWFRKTGVVDEEEKQFIRQVTDLFMEAITSAHEEIWIKDHPNATLEDTMRHFSKGTDRHIAHLKKLYPDKFGSEERGEKKTESED